MVRRSFLVTSRLAAAFGSVTATIKGGYAPVNGLEIMRSMARVSRWCCCTASTRGRQERRRLGRIGHIERPDSILPGMTHYTIFPAFIGLYGNSVPRCCHAASYVSMPIRFRLWTLASLSRRRHDSF